MMLAQFEKNQTPERSCVACRTRRPQWELLRVALDPQNVLHLDYLGKLPGRGAYVCLSLNCLQKASKQGGFSKAFRSKVQVNAEQLWQEAYLASSKQICSLLSLANRAKSVSAGHSRVEFALRQQKANLLLLAHDASDGIKRKFASWATRINVPNYQVLSKEELAPSVGSASCAVLTIDQAGFAETIEKEVQRSHQLRTD